MGVFEGFPIVGGVGGSKSTYGDGSDGDVILAVNTALSRDMFYNNLTVNAGITLTNNGAGGTFRIHVKNQLINLGTISSKGAAGADATPGPPTGGAAIAVGTIGINAKGSDGGANAGGPAGDSIANSMGGSGGAGGIGFAGAGYAAGAATAPTAAHGTARSVPEACVGMVFGETAGVAVLTQINGGAGGGGGCGDGANAGGGAGAGGGPLLICARQIFNSGTITANGGAGGHCSTAGGAGTCGGGGGGGGGVVWVVCDQYSGPSPTVAGGAGGVGNLPNNASDGVAGVAGTVVLLVN